jgi:hypothetical protein
MNEQAILSLISDLYQQVTAYQQRIVALEEEVAELRVGGAEPLGDPEPPGGDRAQ